MKVKLIKTSKNLFKNFKVWEITTFGDHSLQFNHKSWCLTHNNPKYLQWNLAKKNSMDFSH